MMIMEYMEHGSLYDILHNNTMIMEGELLLNILRDITQGVRFLHSAVPQVVHGDLKAANILVDSRFRAKVADFGLSQKQNLGGTGTPFWMAPELLRGESANTAATDVFSFGIILYEVYSRKDPYEGEEDAMEVLRAVRDKNVRKRPPFHPNMCGQVASLMSDCIEDDPELRPTFEEIDTRLRRVDAATIDPGEVAAMNSSSTVSLFDIFPRHIAEALRDGKTIEPEHKNAVTIFFSDIVGYTSISSMLEPRKIANMLDRLYTKLDKLSDAHEVFKVETIGDSYMAVTNLVKDQSDDHAKRIAEFAIDAIAAANSTLVDPDEPCKGYVNIRVGFHSGPVVADVVGTRSPRYCLFGDSVNTASRMESNSKVNRIQCSDSSASLLKEQCPDMPLKCRGDIAIKGKGKMKTWWVNEGANRRPSDDQVLLDVLGTLEEEPSGELEMPHESVELKAPAVLESAPTGNYVQETNSRDVSRDTNGQTVTRQFVAPPGRLGIGIDTTKGSPAVYVVSDDSPIKDQVIVGDCVVSIDGVDTRSMTHTAISALVAANIDHDRNFTVERTLEN